MQQKNNVRDYLLKLQQTICEQVLSLDPSLTEQRDEWQRDEGGGGISRAFAGGEVFDKGGVNFSHVMGSKLPPSATAARPELVGRGFEAMGVSIVLHPKNPYAPTSHCNVRFFIAEKEGCEPVWWFGGGYDLTPYYGFKEDCEHWHHTAKNACDSFGDDTYAKYKKWCDEYFYIKHRDEPRGIGGLFFDDLNGDGKKADFDPCFDFMQAIGNSFMPAYMPLIARRKDTPFGERESNWQQVRRGRYVEFNLVWDRGTLFGLQSGGRTESILMSMPPNVQWHYQHEPEAGSAEAALMSDFLIGREWI